MPKMLIIFFTVLIDLIGFGIVIPLLPFYAELPQFNASPTQIGLLMAIYSLGQFLFSPLWGAISDRVGRRPVLLVSTALGTLSVALFASATSLWMLFLARGLHGIFAANISAAQAYMADITSHEDRAKGMGLIGAGFALGFTIGPYIGGELSTVSYTTPIWIAAALSAINFLLILTILPESRNPEQISERPPRPLNPLTMLEVLRMPAVGLIILLTFISTYSFSTMTSSFALYEELMNNMGPQSIGRLFAMIGVIGIVVQGGLIGRLSKLFGEGALIRVGVVCVGAGILAIPVVSPGLESVSASSLGAVCAIIALFNGITQPSIFSLISKRTSPADQGLVMGTNHSISALARTISPAIALALFDFIHPSVPFILGGGMLMSGGVVAWLATRATATT